MLLTLYTIGTYMDRSGFAFPSQQLIATGIRASVKTVQRHLEHAALAGWIVIEIAGRGGKGWRHYAYRASVPDHVLLDHLDERIADAIQAQEGGIGDDTIVSPRTAESSRRGPEGFSSPCERGDIHVADVTTNGADGGDTGVQNVATQLCRSNSRSATPASKTLAKKEAPAEVGVALVSSKHQDQEPDVRQGRVSIHDDRLWRALIEYAESSGNWVVKDLAKRLSERFLDVTEHRLWRLIRSARKKRESRQVIT